MNQLFRKQSEGVIASYNYTDLASGTGYITYYAGKLIDRNILSSNTFYSFPPTTTIDMAGTGNTKRIDYDFDVLFNTPQTIKGLGIVNVPIAVNPAAASASNGYVIAKLRKWDGATETEIVSNTSSTLSSTGSGYVYRMTSIDLDIPQTLIKKGEYLRLTIEVWGAGGANPSYVRLGHDPMNITDATYPWGSSGIPPTITVQIPFRINK